MFNNPAVNEVEFQTSTSHSYIGKYSFYFLTMFIIYYLTDNVWLLAKSNIIYTHDKKKLDGDNLRTELDKINVLENDKYYLLSKMITRDTIVKFVRCLLLNKSTIRP